VARGRDQVLALAALFQAAGVVRQLARRGWAEAGRLRACLDSVLALEAEDTAAVFGGPGRLCAGLGRVRDGMISGSRGDAVEEARYVVAASQLAGRLRRHPEVQGRLGEGLARLAEQAWEDEEGLAEALGGLYADTLGRLPPRILVHGEPRYLQDPKVAATIRAALLAAVRAAWLWHQLGGRRWHWVVYRRRLAAVAAGLMAEGGC